MSKDLNIEDDEVSIDNDDSDKNIKVADARSYKRDIGVLVNKVRKKYNMKKNKGTFIVQDKGDGIKIVIKKSD